MYASLMNWTVVRKLIKIQVEMEVDRIYLVIPLIQFACA
jgi:hypothetical protein